MSACTSRIFVTQIKGTERRELSVDQTERPVANMHGNQYKNRYDFGFRQMGDILVGRTSNMHIWNDPLNVELIITCKAPKDQIISNADVQFDQSLNGKQKAKIVAGAIGTEFLEIYIKAHNTFWLKYDVKFYGKDSKK